MTAFHQFVDDRLPSSCSITTAVPKIASSSSSLSNRSQDDDFHLLQRYGGVDQTHCVNLERNELFEALVDLYESIFSIHWHHFKTFVQSNYFSPPGNHYADNPCRFAAAVYVSTWFHDHYVTNGRIASRAIFNPAWQNYYSLLENINLVSKEYDAFLSLLSSVIRPTIINTIHESTLFVPIINDIINPNAPGRNYFDIDGWVMDDAMLHGLLDIIHHHTLFKTRSLSLTPALGRPSWLFDWHDNGKAYAWFPWEGNYSIDDVAIAYILGVACTPRLGPRDFDEWQLMPNNDRYSSLPAPTEGRRVRPMVLFGDEETSVHVYEHRTYHFPAEVKSLVYRQVSEEYSEVNFEGLEEYRIVSYVHHGCVVSRVNAKSRSLYFCHIVQPPR